MPDRIPTMREMERLILAERTIARAEHERSEALMDNPKPEPKRGPLAKVLGLFRRQP